MKKVYRKKNRDLVLLSVSVVLFASSYVMFSYAVAYANPKEEPRLLDPKVYKIDKSAFIKTVK